MESEPSVSETGHQRKISPFPASLTLCLTNFTHCFRYFLYCCPSVKPCFGKSMEAVLCRLLLHAARLPPKEKSAAQGDTRKNNMFIKKECYPFLRRLLHPCWAEHECKFSGS